VYQVFLNIQPDTYTDILTFAPLVEILTFGPPFFAPWKTLRCFFFILKTQNFLDYAFFLHGKPLATPVLGIKPQSPRYSSQFGRFAGS